MGQEREGKPMATEQEHWPQWAITMLQQIDLLVEEWRAGLVENREHCSLCSHAKVSGLDSQGAPWVVCELYSALSPRMLLVKLIRGKRPMAFSEASRCNRYDPLSNPL